MVKIMGTKPVLYMPRYYCTIMERHLNGKDTIYKENALVQYDDENNEYFYPGDKDNGYENMKNYVMCFCYLCYFTDWLYCSYFIVCIHYRHQHCI